MSVFGQNGSFRIKVVVFLQSGCILAKWLYSGKVVVIGQNWLYAGKVVVFRQK